MIRTPEGLIPWATRLEKIFAKPYPPVAEPYPDQRPPWEKYSNWSLVCEEALDTESDQRFLRMCYDELRKRGFDDATIQEMRRFAWLTAGWLNFEKALWDWACLDENDVKLAIRWQYDEKLLTEEEYCQMMDYIERYQ